MCSWLGTGGSGAFFVMAAYPGTVRGVVAASREAGRLPTRALDQSHGQGRHVARSVDVFERAADSRRLPRAGLAADEVRLASEVGFLPVVALILQARAHPHDGPRAVLPGVEGADGPDGRAGSAGPAPAGSPRCPPDAGGRHRLLREALSVAALPASGALSTTPRPRWAYPAGPGTVLLPPRRPQDPPELALLDNEGRPPREGRYGQVSTLGTVTLASLEQGRGRPPAEQGSVTVTRRAPPQLEMRLARYRGTRENV